MKNTEREYNLIKKKYDKINDWRYVDRLEVKIEEDKLQIGRIEKDNQKLNMAKKKAEYRIARNCVKKGIGQFSNELKPQELIDLD